MKNYFRTLVIVTMGLLSASTSAQIFGVKAGIGIANFTSANDIVSARFGRTFGAKLGGTVEFDLTDQLYLGSGLNFVKRGAATSTGSFNNLYVEVPVGARFDIVEVGSGYLFANAGFNLGVMVSSRSDGTKLGIGIQDGDIFKGLDFGFNTGAGFIFNDTFEVGLNLELGLLDISSSGNTNLKNFMLLATVGYKFGQ